MKAYILSLAAGLLVGVFYNLVGVRSPAPPVIALVGLLGILAGEQIPAFVKSLWTKESLTTTWLDQCRPHMFGRLPGGGDSTAPAAQEVFSNTSKTEA
jgi:XapX domain-containing protein